MVLFAILQEVLKIVIIVWHLLKSKVLAKCLTQIENLKVPTLTLLQQCPIDLYKFRQLCDCPHPYIGIPEFLTNRVMLYIQRLNVLE